MAAILQATTQVLIDDGYDKATTNRIAKVAGVSIGTLYQYFPNKDALLAELLEQHIKERVQLVQAKVGSFHGLPLETAVRELISAVVEDHQCNPKLHRVFIEQFARVTTVSEVRAILDHVTFLVRAALEARRSELRISDLETASFMLVQAVTSIMHASNFEDRFQQHHEPLVAELTDLVLRYLSAET